MTLLWQWLVALARAVLTRLPWRRKRRRSYSALVLDVKPIAYWRLDDGDDVARDASGNGRHGTYA